MKNEKGITLVALVITIIVLLILAAVSIAALGGTNGILTNATNAKQQDEIGAAKDQVALKANEGINNYFKTNYVDTTNGVAKTKTAQEYVYDAIAAAVTADGKISSAKAEPTITKDDSNVITKCEIKLTSSDGKVSVTGTIDANGGLTWGAIR